MREHQRTLDAVALATHDDVGRQKTEYLEVLAQLVRVEHGAILCFQRFTGDLHLVLIGDLRAASEIVRGRKVAKGVQAMVVPGSQQVKAEAEKLGLDRIFVDAGFEWRESGCSMCLGMNPDILKAGERCASTSNRNFEGRQGKGGRTHLVSPVMAAAAAVTGHFVDVREWPAH